MARKRGMPFERLASLIGKALAYGARRKSSTGFAWDIAGRCTAPVRRELYARPTPAHRAKCPAPVATGDQVRDFIAQINYLFGPRKQAKSDIVTIVGGKTRTTLYLDITVRCRKCERCLAMRGNQWRARAMVEVADAARNWFGTITLRPEAHHHFWMKAVQRATRRGFDLEAQTFAEQFQARHYAISGELTKWLKRVRKNSGARFRYLLVAEHHKTGLPHYHVLLHETEAEPIRKAVLDASWPFGFSKWRLIPEEDHRRRAAYVCKYLTKTNAARVRASVGYGKGRSVNIASACRTDPPKQHAAGTEQKEPKDELPSGGV